MSRTVHKRRLWGLGRLGASGGLEGLGGLGAWAAWARRRIVLDILEGQWASCL